MNRIRVSPTSTGDPYTDENLPHYLGWFDADKATRFAEDTDWDGNNHISVNTGSQWNHEELYRTAKGRWVLGTYSDYQGTTPRYEYVDDERAKTWLTVNDRDAAVKQHFGEVEEERGPGRPKIEGEPINIKLGDVQPAVEAYAKAKDMERAPAIRELLGKALDAEARAERQDPNHPLAHGNHCVGDPVITTDGIGQYSAECNACTFEVTGCEDRAEAGAAFYATVRTELLG